MVDKFGASSVFGRVLGVGEMRRMALAQRVYQAYQARRNYRDADGAENWAEFATRNPKSQDLLTYAMNEAIDV